MLKKILIKFDSLKGKLKINSVKKIKGYSILIIPTGAGVEAKTHHLSARKAYTVAAVYSLVIFLLGFFLINLTPVKGLIFPGSNSLTPSEKKLVNEINQKMLSLTEELRNLKSTNQDLKKAMMIEDSTHADSVPGKKVDTNRGSKKNPYGGDVLPAFNEIITKIIFQQKQQANSGKLFYFIRPLIGFISRGFDPAIGHMGIDIVAKVGTPVAAAASGYVVFADYTVRDGYMMIINHSNGYVTVYKHCSALLKKPRDIVTGGEIIALSGNSGEMTTGPHLHFEIWKNGKPINPKNLFLNN